MDLIRLTARLILDTAAYESGIKKANKEAKETAKNVGDAAKQTDNLNRKASDTSKTFRKYGETIEEVNDSIKEINRNKKLEQKLFDEGKISLRDYTDDMKNLNGQLAEAKQQYSDMKSESKGLNMSGGQALSMAKSATLLAAAVKLLVSAVKHFDKVASESEASGFDLTTNARRLGMTTQELQEWKGVIAESGGKSEKTVDAILSAQEFIKSAGEGNYSETTALKSLGLNAQTLSGMSGSQQFRAILEGLQSVRNDTERAQLAEQIFGTDAYTTVLPFADSKANISDLVDAAYKDTLITTEATIAEATEKARLAEIADLSTETRHTTAGANSWIRNIGRNVRMGFGEFTQWLHNNDPDEIGYSINPEDYGSSTITNQTTVNVQIGDKEFKDYVYETTQEALDERGLK